MQFFRDSRERKCPSPSGNYGVQYGTRGSKLPRLSPPSAQPFRCLTASFIGNSALARFDRDVLLQAGVTHVLVLEGINDIGLPLFLNNAGLLVPFVTADQIIVAYKQFIAQAHAAGLTIIGGTLTPSRGFTSLPLASDYDSDIGETKRQDVNEWIRNSGAFDAVVDFDKLLHDPDDPRFLRDGLHADGLHPNDAGYGLMAEEVERVIFPLR
ncbi:MAG: GDSL-type esterase/lipase family protein [Gammaproteobacteria bacterium]|nr:GDSL-type esterase/lipase family protein [Gammaproteobacteria bacterium]